MSRLSTSTPDQFADLLDVKLGELVDKGYEVRRLLLTRRDIEQLFIDRGDGAVLMDSDPAQDRAWYGRYELTPALDADASMIMYGQGDRSWIADWDAVAPPLADELRAAA
jgi:hypothetical protein